MPDESVIRTDKLGRLAALSVWIALVLFSSTELAGEWAESLYTAVTSALDASPSKSAGFLVAQKSYHILLFTVFGWLLAPVFSLSKDRRLIACMLCCFTLGILGESLQFFFARRSPTLFDVALNGLSGTIASFLRIRGL